MSDIGLHYVLPSMTSSSDVQLAEALERERQRREVVRQRRADRDAARLREALEQGEQAQRIPLLLRFTQDLRQLQAARRSQDRADRTRRRAGEAWAALGVGPDRRVVWARMGLGPAEVALIADVASRVAQHHVSPPQELIELSAHRPMQAKRLIQDIEVLPATMLPAAVIDLSQALGVPLEERTLERLIALDLTDPPSAELRLIGSAAWLRWALSLKLLRRVPTPDLPRAVQSILDESLLDELLDGGYMPDAAVIAPELRLYLQARTQPATLTDDEVDELQWTDERARRHLVAGRAVDVTATTAPFRAVVDLLHGADDYAALKVLSSAGTPEQRRIASHLLEVAAGADPHPALDADATVWPVLERLLDGRLASLLMKRPTAELSVWLGLRGLRRAVFAGDVLAGLSISGPLLLAASPPQAAELHTGRAYLYALAGDRRRAIAQAKAAVKKAKSPQSKTNLAILEDGRASSRLSPFLILGIESEAVDWESAYDTLYKRYWRSDRAEDLNWAVAALRGLEPTLTWFNYPLKPVLYSPIIKGSGLLRPAAQPMPRSTPVLQVEHVGRLHLLACSEIRSTISTLLTPTEQT